MDSSDIGRLYDELLYAHVYSPHATGGMGRSGASDSNGAANVSTTSINPALLDLHISSIAPPPASKTTSPSSSRRRLPATSMRETAATTRPSSAVGRSRIPALCLACSVHGSPCDVILADSSPYAAIQTCSRCADSGIVCQSVSVIASQAASSAADSTAIIITPPASNNPSGFLSMNSFQRYQGPSPAKDAAPTSNGRPPQSIRHALSSPNISSASRFPPGSVVMMRPRSTSEVPLVDLAPAFNASSAYTHFASQSPFASSSFPMSMNSPHSSSVPRSPSMSLAPSVDLSTAIVTAYFTQALTRGNIIFCINPAVYLRRIARGVVHPMLQYAVLAEAIWHTGTSFFANTAAVSRVWERQARAHDDISDDLEVILALTMLMGACCALRNLRQVYIDSGRIIRLLQVLGIDDLDVPGYPMPRIPIANPVDYTEVTLREMLRRLWWSAVMVDRWGAMGSPYPLACHDSDGVVRLPSNDIAYASEVVCDRLSPFLDVNYDIQFATTRDASAPVSSRKDTWSAEVMRMTMYIGRMPGLIGSPFPSTGISLTLDAREKLLNLEQTLAVWQKGLNEHMRINFHFPDGSTTPLITGSGVIDPGVILLHVCHLAGRILALRAVAMSLDTDKSTMTCGPAKDSLSDVIGQIRRNIRLLTQELRLVALYTENIWTEHVNAMMAYGLFGAALADLEHFEATFSQQMSSFTAASDGTISSVEVESLIRLIYKCEARWAHTALFRQPLEEMYLAARRRISERLRASSTSAARLNGAAQLLEVGSVNSSSATLFTDIDMDSEPSTTFIHRSSKEGSSGSTSDGNFVLQMAQLP